MTLCVFRGSEIAEEGVLQRQANHVAPTALEILCGEFSGAHWLVAGCRLRVIALTGAGGQARFCDFDFDVVVFVWPLG